MCLSISGQREAAAREWYTQNQMPLLAWSPLASGFFSGRFRRDNLHLFGEREWDRVSIQSYATEANFHRLDRARELAAEKGLTAAQIALAYVLNQPMNVFVVVGSSSGEKFRLNIEACSVNLTRQETAWLDLRRDAMNG